MAANGNGQPGCRTQEEITTRDWRNNWDPTRFWRCTNLDEAAVAVTCEQETGQVGGFMTSVGGCVSWDDWVWEPTANPPSSP